MSSKFLAGHLSDIEGMVAVSREDALGELGTLTKRCFASELYELGAALSFLMAIALLRGERAAAVALQPISQRLCELVDQGEGEAS